MKKTVDQLTKSNFLIPLAVKKSNLEKTLNERIDDQIFSNKITEGKLEIFIKKSADIRLGLANNAIQYRVPLHIRVKRNTFLADVEAEGDIALHFATQYQLATNWSIKTNTELASYDWIKTPEANVMGVKIPIKAIAERIIRTSSKNLTTLIDKQVNDNFDLKNYATLGWQYLQNSILLSPDYAIRFKFTPTGLALAPLTIKDDAIVSTLFVQGSTQFGLGEQTNFVDNVPLLPLQIQDFGEASGVKINAIAEVPFAEMERVILKNFSGQSYAFGNSKIEVADLKLTKDGEVLTIRLKTKGVYEGWLTLKGGFAYHKLNNQVELTNLDFSFDTKNILQENVPFMLNGLFTSQLAGNLAYSLDPHITFLKEQMNAQITEYQIQKGILLKGEVRVLIVETAELKADTFLIGVQLVGDIRVVVDSIA